MAIFKDKKIKNITVICITLISLLELYLVYKISNDYAGVYHNGTFIAIIFQPFCYNSLFKKQNSYFKLRAIGIVFMSIILPFTVYFTLPNYTYNEGKQMVERYVQSSKNTEFINISKNEYTVPLADNSNQLFISNKAYYYGIKSTFDNKYFMVNPLTGKVVQLSEDFFIKYTN